MSGPELATQKRVADMTPVERRQAREALGITREMLAAPCYIASDTIAGWENGVAPRNRLAFKCYIEVLQDATDSAQ